MSTKGTKKTASKKTTKKPAAKKVKAVERPKPIPAEIWACTVEGWVRYRSTRYEKGDTILVQPDKMNEKDLATLRKYFKPMPTESVKGVSEPIELLDEGENHGSSSN